MDNRVKDQTIKNAVRDSYGRIARQFTEIPRQASCCCGPQPTPCCDPTGAVAAEPSASARFYSTGEIGGLPASVTGASLGCGNPIAISELKPGEVVLDLGSGGGIDCFLAAQRVGPEGRVIGLDMTPEMIKLARRNAREIGATNVDFRFGEMEDIPLPGESVDVIISNCVINLSPDKDAVFAEAYRVLRPGGRLNVSDIVLESHLPDAVRSRLDAWAGCVAGALLESDYLGKMRAAGFEQVEVLSRDYAAADLLAGEEPPGASSCCCGQAADGLMTASCCGEPGISIGDISGKVASIRVTARKPAG